MDVRPVADLHFGCSDFSPITVARMALAPQVNVPWRARRVRLSVENLVLACKAQHGTGQTTRVSVGVAPGPFLLRLDTLRMCLLRPYPAEESYQQRDDR